MDESRKDSEPCTFKSLFTASLFLDKAQKYPPGLPEQIDLMIPGLRPKVTMHNLGKIIVTML